jgi:hypothetical protein
MLQAIFNIGINNMLMHKCVFICMLMHRCVCVCVCVCVCMCLFWSSWKWDHDPPAQFGAEAGDGTNSLSRFLPIHFFYLNDHFTKWWQIQCKIPKFLLLLSYLFYFSAYMAEVFRVLNNNINSSHLNFKQSLVIISYKVVELFYILLYNKENEAH